MIKVHLLSPKPISRAQFPFSFLEPAVLINADTGKRKLPSLLVNDCSNRHKKGWNAFIRSRYHIKQFKKKNPDRFSTLTNRIINDLNELEKAVSCDR
jgi:hypothetical protein